MTTELKYYCEYCCRVFGDDEIDGYASGDGSSERVHRACQHSGFKTLTQPATLKSTRWINPSDVKRCASLVRHLAEHWGPEANLEHFMRWLGEHENGYGWEEDA